ncbi:hypothetical protein KI387_026223 [Taxus chinensis]|uniref:DNA2/NAM7 helicase-like C-terminal domain-containing protein n=1 Tax=Taxus chinensis TaxID=29808 RepID=A0AA38FY02_TAXCH|nr:hypothetical protein KI387_026223 [Taxus chinensis]
MKLQASVAGCPAMLLFVLYRMHPQIRDPPSIFLYQNRLCDSESVTRRPDEVYFYDSLLRSYLFYDVTHGRGNIVLMDWDMKTSSFPWDWDNLMLFPNRRAKAQWENDTVAAVGHAEIDNSSIQNRSVYSPGYGSGPTFGYDSFSKSSISVDFSTKAKPDLYKIKVESMESGFLDLRSQMGSRTTEPESRKSSEI